MLSATAPAQVLLMLMLTVALSAPALAQAAAPLLKPTGGLWPAGPGFAFDLKKKKAIKARQSVSGIACNPDASGRRICLVAFDEGAEARYAYVDGNNLTPLPETIALQSGDGELDAEGAATDGRYVYVTGSHSAKRSDCSSNPASRHVIRIGLDPATGLAQRTADGKLADLVDSNRLWSIMQAQPELAAHVGENKCLGSQPPPNAPQLAGLQGVNIEGLALRGGRLYFGFRGPVLDSTAHVLAVDAEALFATTAKEPRARLSKLALGGQRGIRDMVAVSDGLLLLAGPDDSDANRGAGWTVSWWDGQAATSGSVIQPRLLARLDLGGVQLRACDKELKPEAMTVLEETPAGYKLLVLSDGMCDGGPLLFDIRR